MANRVRFLSLTLAGFGRYDRPTRFRLDGRSCTFTSPNELGKSTFLAGLLATVFGPPAVRAKAAAFQSRHRSWHGPIAFSGELDFAVNDEPWRIRQDFDALETKVWRLSKDGTAELRVHIKVKSGRIQSDADQYARLLHDWFGMNDISSYEAMFTISQESTLSASWQVDPRIAALVYGPAVERLGKSLHELFERFRDITRNTRDFHIAVGSQGERNGRSEGRLDHVLARTAELESNQRAARDRVQSMSEYRVRLDELSARSEQLRGRLAETRKSQEAWQSWIELEKRLQPAVESYERLSALNEQCQSVTRPLAEIRSCLLGDLAVFDRVPPGELDRLEYYPLLQQMVNDAKERHTWGMARATQVHSELARVQDSYDVEFSHIRNRPELPDQVEELRLVREEIACVRARIEQLGRSDNSSDEQRMAWSRRREELERWRELADLGDDHCTTVRAWIDSFCQRHAEFEAMQDSARSEALWLADQDRTIADREVDRAELAERRRQEETSMAAAAEAARVAAERADSARTSLAIARADLNRRFVDFTSAPTDLLELWDRVHGLEAEANAERRTMVLALADSRNLDRRVRWRRTLAACGAFIALVCPLIDHRWLGWIGSTIAVGLVASLRWVYGVNLVDIAERRRAGQRCEAEIVRLGRQRDQLIAQLGPHFVVPPEREAEWRRLWPTYRRELQQLDAREASLPATLQIADWNQQATQIQGRLARFKEETRELLEEADQALGRARAERIRRQHESDRLNEQIQTHIAVYFAATEPWHTVAIQSLPADWQSVLQLARADAPHLESVLDLVAWCRSLDDAAWRRFHEQSRELKELDALLAPDPAELAAREKGMLQASDELRSLQDHDCRLSQAILPFTAQTEPEWLRARRRECISLEGTLEALRREAAELPDIDQLAAELHRAERELAEAAQALAPLLDHFEHDAARATVALADRNRMIQQARELEGQAARLVTECGFVSLEQLAHEAGKAEGLVGTIRAESQELLASSDELWQAVDAPPELAAQRAADLESRRADLQSTLDNLERERAELAATLRQMEADPANDIESIDAELTSLANERLDLEKRRDQIAAEFQEANRLMQELKRVERTALEGRITAYFADFSRTANRRIELDDELRITVRNEDGTRYAPGQLSHGARDQLYLAVYLATTAGFDLPFILDDPFVNCDAERLAAIRACWDRLIPDHQLILLSHDPQLAAWAPAIELLEAA